MDLSNVFANIFEFFTKTNIFVGVVMLAPIVFLFMRLTESGKNIARSLWGKFESREELKKFLFLAFIFFIIIGVYWSLRPLKDSIFMTMVGSKQWLALAKIVSLIFMVPLILFYNKMIDKYPRHKLFYILFSTYGVVTLIFMGLFLLPSNQAILLDPKGALHSPYNLIGWIWYFYVESYGSMLVALFWAFSVDITKAEPAKRGFPLIFLFGQLGNIFGPSFINTRTLGFSTSAPILAILASFMFSVVALLWVFLRVTPKGQMEGFEAAETVASEKKHEESGFWDGLKLLLRHNYLLGIYCIIMFFEVIVTMFDWSFKGLVKVAMGSEVAVSGYLSSYAMWTGIVSFLCVFFGINNIQRKLGMKISLILLPVIVFIAFSAWRVSGMFPLSIQVIFLMWIMVFSKAVNYALNQPALKQVYIPTTKETKYKAQSWIEMFGGRSSKGIGSLVNTFTGHNFLLYIAVSSGITLGLIGIWIFIAIYVANKYNQATKENKVIC